ncbi:MAG: hypothetical protein LBD24_02875 [Spirochaetaceae bacterium]|nr:hypothetical protein [Spirochaetaceae bacterium]
MGSAGVGLGGAEACLGNAEGGLVGAEACLVNVGGCAKRSRASAATSPLTGHGVAPLGNNSVETAGGWGDRLAGTRALDAHYGGNFGNRLFQACFDPHFEGHLFHWTTTAGAG